MSDHDSELSRSLDAYAAATAGEALDSARLRRRVLQDVAAPRRRAPRKLSFVLALAATFAASAAFAATRPAVRQALRDSWHTLLGAPAPAKPTAPRGRGAAAPVERAPVASAAPPSNEPAPVSLSELPLLPEVPPAPSAPAPGAAPAPSASATAAFAEPAFNAEVESYRQAHRLHFSGAAPAAALAAWDQYLARYAAGTFAQDARFNRALCLVRLGRRDEARRALTPFAEAPIGSYRQQEAASLLLSLGNKSL